MLENSALAKSWDTEEISEATEGLDFALFDQCRFGLRHLVNKIPMKKLTQVAGQTEVIQELKEVRCLGEHQHYPIEGGFKGADGKWHSLSEYAGGYPAELRYCILKGAEAFCRSQETLIGDGDNYEFDDITTELQDGDEILKEEEPCRARGISGRPKSER